jgi:peptidoglycan/LPS O-acetylase OafA/YrhL
MLLVLFAVPYIASSGSASINSLYEFVCIATIFPFIVWLGACGSLSTNNDSTTHSINKFLGDLSYPLYIVHYPIMYVFYAWLIRKEYYSLGDCWGVATLVVAASIALAYATLKLYDEPLRRWLAKKFIK